MAGWQDAPPVPGNAPNAPVPSAGKWSAAPAVGGVADTQVPISLLDTLRRQTKTGQYAPPQEPSVTEGNPEASQLPGVLGQGMNTFNSFTHGAMDTTTLGLGDELYAGVVSPFKAAGDAFQGKGFDIPRAFQETLKMGEDRAANLRGLNPQAYDAGSTFGTIGLMGKSPISGAMVPAVTKGLIKRAALQSGATGVAMGAGTPGTIQERAVNALEVGVPSAVLGAAGGKLANVLTTSKVPVSTLAELFDKGDAAFKAARSSGAVVSQNAAAKTIADIRQTLIAEGAITPSGKVADLPKINHALSLADDYASGPVSIEQLLRIRKQFAKAAGSADKEERTLGVQLIRQLDDAVTNLGPQDFAGSTASLGKKAIKDWEVGRDFWHTAKKAESVEKLVTSARKQSRKSAAVPMEQATRNKFASFTDNEKNLRGFSPKERKALDAVSNGSTFGNAAKQVGRLAPTTLGGLTFKAGVPAAVGTAMGGPILGGILAGGSIGLGVLGKVAAGLSTANKAKLAQVLIRNGGQLPKAAVQNLPKSVRSAIGAALVAGSVTGGRAVPEGVQSVAGALQGSGR